MNTHKCPICGATDFIRYQFVSHTDDKGQEYHDNPSDYYQLFLCPDLHVYDEHNEIVKQHSTSK